MFGGKYGSQYTEVCSPTSLPSASKASSRFCPASALPKVSKRNRAAIGASRPLMMALGGMR